MSCWYTRKELALRISILYSGLLIAQAFSGIIAAGIFNGLEGTGGMLAWQWYVYLQPFRRWIFRVLTDAMT